MRKQGITINKLRLKVTLHQQKAVQLNRSWQCCVECHRSIDAIARSHVDRTIELCSCYEPFQVPPPTWNSDRSCHLWHGTLTRTPKPVPTKGLSIILCNKRISTIRLILSDFVGHLTITLFLRYNFSNVKLLGNHSDICIALCIYCST